jgi:hypothetical protein
LTLSFRSKLSLTMLWLAFLPDSSAQQSTTGYCSPAIENVTGNVVTNCYTTVTAWRKSVDDNLAEAVTAIRELLATQRYYLFPSLDEYLDNPSPETWKAAQHDIALVTKRVALATEAALHYDASLEPELGPNLKDLHDALRSRGGLMSELPSDPPSEEYLREWMAKYTVQVSKLRTELTSLQKQLNSSPYNPQKQLNGNRR